MQDLTVQIPARSRRQAMDWGLVLASQGLEPVIEQVPEDHGWALAISAQHHQKAIEAIRLYELENRRWPWRREVLQPGLLFDWGSLAWVALLGVFFWLSRVGNLESVGIMDTLAISRGQWWRFFTAIWLHADPAHLAGNATIGFVLLDLTMARYGTGTGLLAAYVGGAAGNLIVWLLYAKPRLGLGASGMVMACLGLLAAHSFAPAFKIRALRKRSGLDAKLSNPFLAGLAAAAMLFVLLGVSPESDVLTHGTSFLCGLALGGLSLFVPRLPQRSRLSAFCGLAFVVLVALPWYLALRTR